MISSPCFYGNEKGDSVELMSTLSRVGGEAEQEKAVDDEDDLSIDFTPSMPMFMCSRRGTVARNVEYWCWTCFVSAEVCGRLNRL